MPEIIPNMVNRRGVVRNFKVERLFVISELFSFSQIFHSLTHYSHSGTPSTIDLVFVPDNIQPSSCVVSPPVSNSDHNFILFALPLSPNPTPLSPPRRVWLYDKADYSQANELLSAISWDSILPVSDTETFWLIFKELFLHTMHNSIPSELIYPSPHPAPPWIIRPIVSLIKTSNSLYSSARQSNSPDLWAAYCKSRNRALSSLCRSKKRFF